MQHYLEGYTEFKSREEMELAAQEHVKKNWRKMNRTDREVFELICSHSGPFFSVHWTQREMEEKLDVSNSTVRPVMRKLIGLGMIRRVPYIEPETQGPGANIYVILPVDGEVG